VKKEPNTKHIDEPEERHPEESSPQGKTPLTMKSHAGARDRGTHTGAPDCHRGKAERETPNSTKAKTRGAPECTEGKGLRIPVKMTRDLGEDVGCGACSQRLQQLSVKFSAVQKHTSKV